MSRTKAQISHESWKRVYKALTAEQRRTLDALADKFYDAREQSGRLCRIGGRISPPSGDR